MGLLRNLMLLAVTIVMAANALAAPVTRPMKVLSWDTLYTYNVDYTFKLKVQPYTWNGTQQPSGALGTGSWVAWSNTGCASTDSATDNKVFSNYWSSVVLLPLWQHWQTNLVYATTVGDGVVLVTYDTAYCHATRGAMLLGVEAFVPPPVTP